MNERQRMQYLDAMGVDMFVPRLLLPSSATPVRCLLPIADPETDSSSPIVKDARGARLSAVSTLLGSREEISSSIKAQQPSAALEVVASKVSPKVEPRVEAAVEKPIQVDQVEAPQLEAVPEAKFSLALCQVSPDLLVIDSREVAAALPTDALLANITRALGVSAQRLPEAEIINWPMVDLPGKPKGWEAAREMVTSLLEGKLLPHPVKEIWLMGEDAYQVMVGEGAEALSSSYNGKLFSMAAIDRFAAQGVILPSLTQLLKEPMLKKSVWQSLIHLKSV